MKLEQQWYEGGPLPWLLLPVSFLFGLLTSLRRLCYRIGLCSSCKLPVPVIVVGNISVGGTGKTPMVEYVARLLADQGYHPGIISRGYGGKAEQWPQAVTADSDAALVGDEPVLIASRTGMPVVVGPQRVLAAQTLLQQHPKADVIISDDGMQHYALQRDIEIAIIDGERRLGNGWLLPAGPLRESALRLKQVDLVVVNGEASGAGEYAMHLELAEAHLLNGNETKSLATWQGQTVHAVAGIGHPPRFFRALQQFGITVIPHPFPDHYAYSPQDLMFDDDLPILMTEKDAVKCRRLELEQAWVVPVTAQLDKTYNEQLLNRLKQRGSHG